MKIFLFRNCPLHILLTFYGLNHNLVTDLHSIFRDSELAIVNSKLKNFISEVYSSNT